MTHLEKMKYLNSCRGANPYAERICAELTYLDSVSENHGGEYDGLIEKAVDYLVSVLQTEGSITKTVTETAETMLAPLVPAAKSYTELFISHAHIDMNWQWGYQETAAITVDTFRTVLALMREYPEMTFGQSQASTYEIIEKYQPELLDEIRERIREGRWEVTAAEWVEPDKNMPDGESLTRQILQARKYLPGLLGIAPASLDLDFVPDSFGHNLDIPEILSGAGIKYMYHCRGYDGPCIYYYVAPSGKKTLVYREYAWYNGDITPEKFEIVPAFCAKERVNTYLCVFGVGDHGGGPSRRDIERIMEYKSWPLTPTIRFGTFHEFFRGIEASGTVFPEKKDEVNFVCTGCYTTQSRIKMANRVSEARMNETEALAAAASLLADAPREPSRLDAPWRDILFSQFHDILPGSGTVETREYAMGLFQGALAAVNTYGGLSMRRIADAVDTSGIPFEKTFGTTSEGGGAGYYQHQAQGFRLPSAERGRGPVRAFVLFNTTASVRNEYAEITVWDYPYDMGNAEMTDADGNLLPFCPTENGNGYWGHTYSRLLVRASVPPFGYSTVILRQKHPNGRTAPALKCGFCTEGSLADEYINELPIIMENSFIRAVFDRTTMHLISLTDKKTGEVLLDEPSCYFRYADENPIYGKQAWRVGPYTNVKDLNAVSQVRVTGENTHGPLRRVSYQMEFGASVLRCTVSLKEDSPVLDFAVTVDWNEPNISGKSIPQISFAVPLSYALTGYAKYDIPYGVIRRTAIPHDVPALSYMTAESRGKSAVSLVTDTKYGFRFWENTASVTLIRSANYPDPYPERGNHSIRIGVMACAEAGAGNEAECFCHPILFTSLTEHPGKLLLSGSAVTVNAAAGVRVSCLKNSENGDGCTVRLFNTAGTAESVSLTFAAPIVRAMLTDTNEIPCAVLPSEGNTVSLGIAPYSLETVVVTF